MEDRIAKIITISKHNGKFRKVFVPTPSYTKQLNEKRKYLNKILLEQDEYKVNHAFLAERNSVTNAMQHIGYRYCLQLDIEDFFDSITCESVKGIIDDRVCDLVFVDGVLRQGLPTSPIVSNIAFIPIDQAILNFVKNLDENIVYTRYADDLTFSFNDIKFKDVIYKRVIKILSTFGFKINNKKTKFQKSVNGNIIITGVAVNEKGIFPTRKTKRKLRALEHQYQKNIKFLVEIIEEISVRENDNHKSINILKFLNSYYKNKDNILNWNLDVLDNFLDGVETVFCSFLGNIYISNIKELGMYHKYCKYNSNYSYIKYGFRYNSRYKKYTSNKDGVLDINTNTNFKWAKNRKYKIKEEDIIIKCNECRYNFHSLMGFRGWASCALPKKREKGNQNPSNIFFDDDIPF